MLRLLRGNAIKVGVLTGLATVLTSCGIGGSSPIHPNSASTPLSETPTQTYTLTETDITTETVKPTEKPLYSEAEIEKANVFDAETFPDRFNKVAEDPASYTDKEWQDYQAWTEALRERFFKQEGFTVELKNIVDPENTTSLWKLLSWQEMNKDRVIKENIRITSTPKEIADLLRNQKQIVQKWEGPLFEGDGFRQYGMFLVSPNEPDDSWIFGYPYFNASNIPGLLLKRAGAEIHRTGYIQITADVAGVAWGRYGREDETVVFLHILNKKGEHALFPLIFPYGKIVFPEGTYCVDDHDRPTEVTASEYNKPLTLPKDFTYKGEKSPEYFLTILGKTIQVSEISTVDDPSMENAIEEKYGMPTMANPLHPYFGMEMGGFVVDWYGNVENPSPKWPYDEFPYLYPTLTPTQ